MLTTRKKCITSAVILSIMIVLSGCSLKSEADSTQKESQTSASDSVSYEEKLFDTSYVHEINIEISEEDWSDLITNPTDKTKYEANITIDGETIKDVSFATKGNTSLTSVAADPDSDRYSFKVNFGKYIDGQTYYGLDKLNLNNIYADATYMKDYISYMIFKEAGVESPLVSYAKIQINGKDFGLYLAIEEIGDSYLERTAEGEGQLYKPETEQLANMGEAGAGMLIPEGMEKPAGAQVPEDIEKPDGTQAPEDMEKPDGTQAPENMENPDGMQKPDGKDMFSSSNGASLKYTDDEIASYSDIFDNAETDSDEADWNRVIQALKNLSEGNVTSAVDTEEVIRYFVAHNFVLNYDSYTGNMLHNYYLYEKEGILSILPWDYNLAYGAFSGANGPDGADTDATSLINTGIDSPLSGTSEEDRPLWKFIVENEEYLDLYHQVYQELLSNYFSNGKFTTELDRVNDMIRPYVQADPSAFYSVDEFDTAFDTLKSFCSYRAESIEKQLSGELATVSSQQNTKDRVDGSQISIRSMGSQNNKQMQGNMQRPNDNLQKSGGMQEESGSLEEPNTVEDTSPMKEINSMQEPDSIEN